METVDACSDDREERAILLVSCPWAHASGVPHRPCVVPGSTSGIRWDECPHSESCTAGTWASSLVLPGSGGRRSGRGLLAAFIDAGILPDPSL